MPGYEKRHGHVLARQPRGGRVSRRVVVVAVVALAVVGAGVLFVGEQSPDDGRVASNDSEGTTTHGGETADGETTTLESRDGGGSDTPRDTESATTSASGGNDEYDFVIENVEECGNTCRDVTATLANTGGETHRNVRVTTKVYADGDLLWTGNETVGRLDASESHTSTKRVNVGFAGGMKIKSNDGYVTIVTVVESASGTTRFEDRRKVA